MLVEAANSTGSDFAPAPVASTILGAGLRPARVFGKMVANAN
jgi:hypothetical protein